MLITLLKHWTHGSTVNYLIVYSVILFFFLFIIRAARPHTDGHRVGMLCVCSYMCLCWVVGEICVLQFIAGKKCLELKTKHRYCVSLLVMFQGSLSRDGRNRSSTSISWCNFCPKPILINNRCHSRHITGNTFWEQVFVPKAASTSLYLKVKTES